ncbi:MAG: 16S rRNA processing protein RimM [Bacteroidetes bacterium RBG_13_43_22]|nr:MAG: 16S rRNA processing protein RimM [Bacteroidetes bacterium RBG_13_43_22]
MFYNTGILLGRITKAYGYEGAVTVRLERRFTDKIPELKSVFLEIEGKPVPFFISQSDSPVAGVLILKFKGYDSIGKISDFAGCRIFLDSYEGDEIPVSDIADITGFKIISADKIIRGTISEILENHGQWLVKLKTDQGKELLIPFHEDLIIRIDKRNKSITMDLPEGLTEIN